MPKITPDNDSAVEEIIARSDRARQALLDAVSTVPEDAFAREEPGAWGVARILRHVVWVEYYWTILLRELCTTDHPILNLAEPEVLSRLTAQADRLAGTPHEPLSEPPPYSTRREALECLESSHSEFGSVVSALRPVDFQRRFSHPRRGVASLRYAVEHVIEHDWDHTVQITAVGARATKPQAM